MRYGRFPVFSCLQAHIPEPFRSVWPSPHIPPKVCRLSAVPPGDTGHLPESTAKSTSVPHKAYHVWNRVCLSEPYRQSRRRTFLPVHDAHWHCRHWQRASIHSQFYVPKEDPENIRDFPVLILYPHLPVSYLCRSLKVSSFSSSSSLLKAKDFCTTWPKESRM